MKDQLIVNITKHPDSQGASISKCFTFTFMKMSFKSPIMYAPIALVNILHSLKIGKIIMVRNNKVYENFHRMSPGNPSRTF